MQGFFKRILPNLVGCLVVAGHATLAGMDRGESIGAVVVAIGSTNKVKVQAVEAVIQGYPQFVDARLVPISADSEVSDQPLSLEETIRGAKNRAKNAFAACDACTYSFGIESGLFEAPGTETGFLYGSICSIYDGTRYAIGISCGFEVPPAVLDLVRSDGLELCNAVHQAGVTANPKLGAAEGLIGLLTQGRIDRQKYTEQCITTALIQLENSHLYQPQSLPVQE